MLESATAPLLPIDPRTVFGGMTPEQAAAKVVGTALHTLAGLDLLPAGPASITITSASAGAVTTYGLQAAIPGVVLSGADGSSTKVTLQLGAWPTGDTSPYWIARSLGTAPDAAAPGIDVALISLSGGTMSFAPSIALVSVGIDVSGPGSSPLFELAGVTLGGFESRLYAADAGGSWYGGGLIRVDDLAIPLGPKLGSGANANPIATNLLSSDSGDGTGAGPAVNPASRRRSRLSSRTGRSTSRSSETSRATRRRTSESRSSAASARCTANRSCSTGTTPSSASASTARSRWPAWPSASRGSRCSSRS